MDQQIKDPELFNVLVLERVDRTKNMARYYVLSVEPTLFAESSLVRRWGPNRAPSGHESTFMLPRRSPRSRSIHGSNGSSAVVTNSAPDETSVAFLKGVDGVSGVRRRLLATAVAVAFAKRVGGPGGYSMKNDGLTRSRA